MRFGQVLCLMTLPAFAAPIWHAPQTLPFGQLSTLELLETDPTQPPLPRPGDDTLGPLELRSAEPSPDGRGWKLQVQPLVPGLAIILNQDLGDGRNIPELRIQVPRTVPYGAPWQGHGGGREDRLPEISFPWAWASLLLLPFMALAGWLLYGWRQGRSRRLFHQTRRIFIYHWPPASMERSSLDASHQAGRDLLAARFGEEARSWGSHEFQAHHLAIWGAWVQSLDAARFSRKDPPFPDPHELLKALGERPKGNPQ